MIALIGLTVSTTKPIRADLTFPADAGVVDVTAFGAVPGDGLDDSAAIQSALDANPSGNTIFYFPDGVYDIANTLAPARDDGVTKRNIFQGQSEAGVVLRVPDNSGFAGAVIDYNQNAAVGAAQFFRNAVRDLTIDVGTGNPNANGLRFNASNQGTVRNVTIQAGSDNVGDGLVMGAAEPGPLLIQNVTIDGFGTGLRTILPTASQTVEHLTLRNQQSFGWVNDVQQQVFARGIDYEGDGLAVTNLDQSRMLIVDSTFQGVSPSSDAAIFNNKRLYLRDVQTPGYNTALQNAGSFGRGNDRTGPSTNVIEHWANGAYAPEGTTLRRGGAFELFDSPDTSLRLEVREHPTLAYAPLTEWDGPQNHIIDLGNGQFSGIPNDGVDDTASIQAAIDSGASTIYLPNGFWTVDGEVVVRNNVERVMGSEARSGGTGGYRVVDGAADMVFFERIESIAVEHDSSRPIAFEHLLGLDYEVTAAAPGDVYLNDVAGTAMRFVEGQSVWARQLNIESAADATDPTLPDAKIVNDGADVWVLGLKVEDTGTWVRTINGGKTELLGGVKVGSGPSFGPENALFVTEESSLFAALPLTAAAEGYEYVATEVRGGETRTALSSPSFNLSDVYTAFDADAIRHREVIVDNQEATVAGAWTATDSFPGGFLDEDFLFANAGPGNSVTYTPDLLVDGEYEVFVRWVTDEFADHFGHATNAPVEIASLDGTTTLSVDQTAGGGYWASLGTFDFSADDSGFVRFLTDGANGKVIADAVRFVLTAALLPGDFNGNGQVEQGDLDLVLQNWGVDTGSAGVPAGWVHDARDLGVVDQDELDRVLQNWGGTGSPEFAPRTVPEPGAAALLLLLGGLSMRRRRFSVLADSRRRGQSD